MRSLILAGLATIALTGCVTVQPGQVSDATSKARQALGVICAAEPTAYGIFVAFAPGRASAAIVLRVNQAHAAVTSICANPPSDLPTALQAVASAYAAILSASQQVEVAAAASPVPRATRIIISTDQ
jgi:hypothetical protein